MTAAQEGTTMTAEERAADVVEGSLEIIVDQGLTLDAVKMELAALRIDIASAIRAAESSARQKAEQERDEARAERDAALAENDVNHKWIYCPMCGSCGIGGCCGYFCDLCRDHHDGETPGGSPPRDLGDLRLMQGGWKELVAAAEASAAALRNAVSAVYYAAHWTPDRPVDAAKLWTDLRDAAGFEPGRAPSPEAAGKETPRLAALEEAAQLADDHDCSHEGECPEDCDVCAVAKQIARAIRGLKGVASETGGER